jgi:polyisoprenyl-phosphate glycosyltransferase
MSSPPVISIVTAAYNEAANLPVLYQRLVAVLDGIGETWEWVVVDDHSRDGTFDFLRALAAVDSRVRGIRLSRNSGSHLTIKCGLDAAHGQCAILLAGDMQDPPETVVPLVEKWRAGAQVVWAVRAKREGEKASTLLFARLYYVIMRRFVGLQEMPTTGADFFLLDRRVLDVFHHFQEVNVSIIALIIWMGFRQDHIDFVRRGRLHGTSSWNLGKKIKLVVDSITSFTYLPIRLMSVLGFLIALLGFSYAVLVVVNYMAGHAVTGWSSLMVVVLVLGGFQMLLMGVLGEYIWRTLDEARQRPRVMVEDATSATERVAPMRETGRPGVDWIG